MGFKDIPIPPIPLPSTYDDFIRPIIITKDYYDNLPEHEKSRYTPLNGGNKDKEKKDIK